MATDVNRNAVFCERFAGLRGGRSQAEYAKFLGISRATVGFYENGERVPDANVLKKICEACEVTADYLLGLSNHKNKEGTSVGHTMNPYEKHSLLVEHIQDMEKRLGAYLWMPGCEKTDRYAKDLIDAIQASRAEISEMLNRPV